MGQKGEEKRNSPSAAGGSADHSAGEQNRIEQHVLSRRENSGSLRQKCPGKQEDGKRISPPSMQKPYFSLAWNRGEEKGRE